MKSEDRSKPKPDKSEKTPSPETVERTETDPAVERGERIETGKQIARSGKSKGDVPGAEKP